MVAIVKGVVEAEGTRGKGRGEVVILGVFIDGDEHSPEDKGRVINMREVNVDLRRRSIGNAGFR